MTGIEISYTVVFSLVLVAIGYIDYKYGIIPNRIVYPAAVAALLANIFLTDMGWVNCLIGGAVGIVACVLVWLMAYLSTRGGESSETIGGGDIKLLILVGLIIGYPMAVAVIIAGFIFGGLFGFIKAYYSKMRTGKGIKATARTETAPLAPFLAFLAICWLIIPVFV